MRARAWNTASDVGHADIDAQHRELFRAHGLAVEAARQNDAPSTLAALEELVELTREHFAFEERLMGEACFAQRELHAQAHRMFMADLTALLAQATRDCASPVVALWLDSRIGAWWQRHVSSSDAALAAHLATAALPGAAEAPPGAAVTYLRAADRSPPSDSSPRS